MTGGQCNSCYTGHVMVLSPVCRRLAAEAGQVYLGAHTVLKEVCADVGHASPHPNGRATKGVMTPGIAGDFPRYSSCPVFGEVKLRLACSLP